MNRPTGTVTLLFTDIEGSTKRWETNAQAMRSVLAKHDAVMRKAIADHNGHVFKTIGDAFCAVFQRGEDAVEACLDAQRGLRQIDAPEMGPVRVRMALHTGEADQRDGDYFGTAVNRISKFLSIGHGEQVLLSATTREAVNNSLAADATLRDMGEHRLKDMPEPVHVYQLIHADLRADFPALKSVDSLPNNLPTQLSSFVGRASELKQLRELLHTTSLLTLTGSGGSGKTRLALKLGQELLPEFPDGVWIVELAAISDSTQIPFAMLRALGLQEQADRRIEDVIVGHLAPKSALILLDNCEHILNPCAELVAQVRGRCPNLSVVATSREPLGVEGETCFAVPSLAVPEITADRAGDLMQYDSIALFVARLRLVNPQFTLDDCAAASAVEICRRLDGIPLALELAAALTRKFPLEQIRDKVVERFEILTEEVDTAVRRHKTLENAIEWSYQLLTDDEKWLLRALSVFAGGWTLESLAPVCARQDQDEYVLFELLTQLVAKSLVVVSEEAAAEPRYRFLETIRQFAQRAAERANELDEQRGRYLVYFGQLADTAATKLSGSEQSDWLNRLETEHANLLAAIRSGTADRDRVSSALRIAAALVTFWDIRGYYRHGLGVLDELLQSIESVAAASGPDDQKSLGYVIKGAALLAFRIADYSTARARFEQCLKLFETAGDRAAIAACRNTLGAIAMRSGELSLARDLFEQSLRVREELGDVPGQARCLANLGELTTYASDYDKARVYFEAALQRCEPLGNKFTISPFLCNLGWIALWQGDYGTAEQYLQRALNMCNDIGDRTRIAECLINLGVVSTRMGLQERAEQRFKEALKIGKELRNQHLIAATLDELGTLQMLRGDLDASLRSHEEGLQIARATDDKSQIASTLHQLACLARRRGTLALAVRYQLECVRLQERLKDRNQMSKCLEEIAHLAGLMSASRDACRFLGAAAALRRAIRSAATPDEAQAVAESSAQLRAVMGDASLESAFSDGRALIDANGAADRANREAISWLETAANAPPIEVDAANASSPRDCQPLASETTGGAS